MAKDTSSYRNKQKKPWFTNTVKRIIIWDIAIFFLLFIISNIFIIAITNKILNENLDKEIKNKIDVLEELFSIKNDTIKFVGYGELNEPAFQNVYLGSFFLQVYDISGRLIVRSNNLQSFVPLPFDVRKFNMNLEFEDTKIGNNNLRVAYAPIKDKSSNVRAYIQLAAFENKNNSIMREIIVFNIMLLPVILFLIVISSVFLAKKSYAPLNKIIEVAENITANNLNTRIEYKADSYDELGRLRDTLNRLFSRLNGYINHISQFTDNVSHQLMNPLTAAKTELEYILKRDRKPEEYKESLIVLNSQINIMINIIKLLLTIAKYSTQPELNKSVINVTKVINKTIKPLFNRYNIIYDMQDNIYLRGSSEGFQIIMENLIDNAVKYSNENSEVLVKILKLNERIEIMVADYGIGIPEKEKEKIFERFYRSQNTIKNTNGYGLGLCLVKTITQAMNGNIRVENNVPRGTKFIIDFPVMNME
ncbi:ATP-binding protein [Melioribacteraceae bacterium 4301-Me]|uniref:sensor histidine kinase n=1 Tax=Pyranulibacter aquaticus TaxID=3163344 RepID=UPI003596C62D